MSQPPSSPKIYHITHVENLSNIIKLGGILSYHGMQDGNIDHCNIGISDIKQRRLSKPAHCGMEDNTMVGDYVPFNFCARSVMLYVICKRNHPGLAYQGGQDNIAHLVADLNDVIAWATANQCAWTFTPVNASETIAEFFLSHR